MDKEEDNRGLSQGGATNATSSGVILFTASGEDNPVRIVTQNDLGENDVLLGQGMGTQGAPGQRTVPGNYQGLAERDEL